MDFFFYRPIENVQTVVKIKRSFNEKKSSFLKFEREKEKKRIHFYQWRFYLFVCSFVTHKHTHLNETQSICHSTLEFINLIRVCINNKIKYLGCVCSILYACICAISSTFFLLLLPNFYYWSSLVPHLSSPVIHSVLLWMRNNNHIQVD